MDQRKLNVIFHSIIRDLSYSDVYRKAIVEKFISLDSSEKYELLTKLDRQRLNSERREVVNRMMDNWNEDDDLVEEMEVVVEEEEQQYIDEETYYFDIKDGHYRVIDNPYGTKEKVRPGASKLEVKEVKIETKPVKREYQSLKALNELIGLDKVKGQVNELIALTEISRLRKQHNLGGEKQGLHMIFKGNPGTGKTTVARLLGRIFKEIGVLSSGHVVEIDRSSVVSKYQGEIERKMSEAVDNAVGGILFIDEMYGLFDADKSEDSGKHGINTLLKLVEDRRDEFICIGAGYSDEMDELLGSNPGLKSRFSIHLDFEDYTEEQLLSIAVDMFNKQDYKIDDSFTKLFTECMKEEKDSHQFGNGRVVRNIIESAIRKQSIRLFNSDQDLNRDELMKIVGEDFQYVPVVLKTKDEDEEQAKLLKRILNNSRRKEEVS